MPRTYGKRTAAQAAEDVKVYRRFAAAFFDRDNAVKEAQEKLLGAIIWARRNDMTWTDIGAIAGISRQAAQRKWAHLMPEGV